MCTNDRKHAEGWQSTEDMLPPETTFVLGLWEDETGVDYDICWFTSQYGWESQVDEQIRFHGPPKYWMHIPSPPGEVPE